MPIPTGLWKYNIKGVLERIADEAYQRRAWFAPDGDFQSPSELCMELFDDNFFDDFIGDKDVGFDKDQQTKAKAFSSALKGFFAKRPRYPDPKVVLSDPEWRMIRDEARALLENLAL